WRVEGGKSRAGGPAAGLLGFWRGAWGGGGGGGGGRGCCLWGRWGFGRAEKCLCLGGRGRVLYCPVDERAHRRSERLRKAASRPGGPMRSKTSIMIASTAKRTARAPRQASPGGGMEPMDGFFRDQQQLQGR